MRTLLVFAMLAPAWAQEFEAASVKPAPPPAGGRMMVGMNGGPGSQDPERISYNNVSLKEVMKIAYDVKEHQISGPDWLNSERFDITATMAPGTTKEQFHKMLQNLLAERFKLTLHHEKKDLPAFVLTVSKKGPKMKPSDEEMKKEDGAAPDAPPPPPGKIGKDGFPEMPPGRRGGPSIMMMPGKAKLMEEKTTMDELAGQLERFVGRPVVNQTELKGKFDFELHFAPDMSLIGGGRGVVMMAPIGAAGGAAGEMRIEVTDSEPTIFAAVQEQLGLKLESQKALVDVLVVDRLEKVPTEN
jgi:uncharacterized protein (TIGR03435 family)